MHISCAASASWKSAAGCGLVSLTCCALGAERSSPRTSRRMRWRASRARPAVLRSPRPSSTFLGMRLYLSAILLVASDVGYTEKLALGFARRAAEAIAAGATVVTSDSTKLRWSEFLAEASRLTGRDVRAFSWRDKSNPYVRPAVWPCYDRSGSAAGPRSSPSCRRRGFGALSTSHLRLCPSTRRVMYKEARRTRRSRGKEWTLRDRSTTRS